MFKHLMLVLMSACLIGCTTTHALPVSTIDRDEPPFKRGERLTLIMTDGTERKVEFRRATEQDLITDKGRIPWTEIAQIRDKDFSAGKTIGTTVLTYLAVGIVSMLLLARAFDDHASSND